MKKHKNTADVFVWCAIIFVVIAIMVNGYDIMKIEINREYIRGKVKTYASELMYTLTDIYVPSLNYNKDKKDDGLEMFIAGVMPVMTYNNSDSNGLTVADENRADIVTSSQTAKSVQAQDETQEAITEEVTTNIEESESVTVPLEETEAAVNTAVVSGITYPIEKLRDFDYLINSLYIVDKSTTIRSSDVDVDDMLSRDMTMKSDNSSPQILIYHTHSQEGFTDSTEGDLNTTIVGVGAYLTEVLTNVYGYNVIHDESVYDIINGVLDRSEAYTKSYEGITKILDENKSIEVVIDLHRDGVNENVHLVNEIDGKPTANIMFLNGLSRTSSNGDIAYLYNPYLKDNLSFSLQMKLKAEELYAGFTRKIYLKAYQYNLHVMPKTILIEAGAQTNSFEEVKNAMDPLAKILDAVLRGE